MHSKRWPAFALMALIAPAMSESPGELALDARRAQAINEQALEHHSRGEY